MGGGKGGRTNGQADVYMWYITPYFLLIHNSLNSFVLVHRSGCFSCRVSCDGIYSDVENTSLNSGERLLVTKPLYFR